jgi:hypothetical protein
MKMKMRIWDFFGIAVLTGVIGFSLIQLTTPVVRAEGCPETYYINDCSCQFMYGSYDNTTPIRWYCTYGCTCVPLGGGDNFYIEREYVFEG